MIRKITRPKKKIKSKAQLRRPRYTIFGPTKQLKIYDSSMSISFLMKLHYFLGHGVIPTFLHVLYFIFCTLCTLFFIRKIIWPLYKIRDM
jgi:hypothetical protein